MVQLAIIGFYFQGCGIILDGKITFTHFKVNIPPVTIGIKGSGIKLNGLAEISDSLLVPLHLYVQKASIIISVPKLFVYFDNLGIVCYGLLDIAF